MSAEARYCRIDPKRYPCFPVCLPDRPPAYQGLRARPIKVDPVRSLLVPPVTKPPPLLLGRTAVNARCRFPSRLTGEYKDPLEMNPAERNIKRRETGPNVAHALSLPHGVHPRPVATSQPYKNKTTP